MSANSIYDETTKTKHINKSFLDICKQILAFVSDTMSSHLQLGL